MDRCQFYSSGAGYLYDVYQTEVSPGSLLGQGHSPTSVCVPAFVLASFPAPPSPVGGDIHNIPVWMCWPWRCNVLCFLWNHSCDLFL